MNDKNDVNLEVTEEECLQFNIILSWSPCNHMHVRISPAHKFFCPYLLISLFKIHSLPFEIVMCAHLSFSLSTLLETAVYWKNLTFNAFISRGIPVEIKTIKNLRKMFLSSHEHGTKKKNPESP